MKLLICKICYSVFNLTNKSKSCECGKTTGHYTDTINAVYSGPAIPIGFANTSLLNAIELQEFLNKIEKNNPKVCCKGEEFTAFTIPDWADTITKKNET